MVSLPTTRPRRLIAAAYIVPSSPSRGISSMPLSGLHQNARTSHVRVPPTSPVMPPTMLPESLMAYAFE